MKKFLIIDDHKVVRMGLSYMLNEFYNPCTILEAGNKQEIEENIYLHDYDVVFLDINMQDVNTGELLKNVLHNKPGLKILIFTINTEKLYAQRYLDLGAMGYIQKDASVEELQKAINRISENKKYYSEALMESTMANRLTNSCVFKDLSEREFEIYNLLRAGKSVTEISTILDISTSTTGTHKAKIFKKLNINNLVELIEVSNHS